MVFTVWLLSDAVRECLIIFVISHSNTKCMTYVNFALCDSQAVCLQNQLTVVHGINAYRVYNKILSQAYNVRCGFFMLFFKMYPIKFLKNLSFINMLHIWGSQNKPTVISNYFVIYCRIWPVKITWVYELTIENCGANYLTIHIIQKANRQNKLTSVIDEQISDWCQGYQWIQHTQLHYNKLTLSMKPSLVFLSL